MDNLNPYSHPNDLREWEPYVNQLSITKEFQSRPYPFKFTKFYQIIDANRKAQVLTTTIIYRMMGAGSNEN